MVAALIRQPRLATEEAEAERSQIRAEYLGRIRGRELAELHEQATAGTEVPWRHLTRYDDIRSVWRLIRLREQDGDASGAETLLRQAADHGDAYALGEMARLREQAGDHTGADR